MRFTRSNSDILCSSWDVVTNGIISIMLLLFVEVFLVVVVLE